MPKTTLTLLGAEKVRSYPGTFFAGGASAVFATGSSRADFERRPVDVAFETCLASELAAPAALRLGPARVVVLYTGRHAQATNDPSSCRVEVAVGLTRRELSDREHLHV
jgi:hypothetical protein